MARKLLKRFMPDPESIRNRPGLKLLGSLLHDPNLFHLNRHSISVAAFVGIFTCFLPLPGQMLIAALLALLARCNLPLSVALVWISNPVTIPPIFYATYKLGSWILGTPPIDFNIELTWEWFGNEFAHLWQPLLTGSIIAGIALGSTAYMATHVFWRWHVLRSWRKRQALRSAKQHKDGA